MGSPQPCDPLQRLSPDGFTSRIRKSGSGRAGTRLWRHSYRLGLGWLLRGRWLGAVSRRTGLTRLLVPLDPWRYYEMGRLADQQFLGRGLDVSSPKLLMSLLRHEGNGDWVGIDLFEREIRAWHRVDPALELAVCDATRLPHRDGSFDHCISVAVIEHVPGDGDSHVMAEIWRVLRPGGWLHLTVPIAKAERDVYIDRPVYGATSKQVGGRVFFARHYDEPGVAARLLRLPWRVVHKEFARPVGRSVEQKFYGRTPGPRTRCQGV